MRKHWTFFLLFISHIGFSQCYDIEKLDLGGSYISKTNNYIPFETKCKDSIYYDNISYPIDLNKIEKYYNFILPKVKEYIISRANEDFYNRLKIHQIEVNYPETIKIESYDDENLYELSNFEVTYWFIYTYEKDTYKYAFGLEFDKEGKMISENKFPDYSKNKTFEKFTNPCDALKIVKSNKQFKNKKVDYIELAYLEDKNSFCWLIEELPGPNKEFGKWEEKIVNLYYVNANSNKLELVKEEKNMSIACGIRRLTKKEIRQRKRDNKNPKVD